MTPILIAIPADAMMCKDVLCIHAHCQSCWCKPFERIYWMVTYDLAFWLDTYWCMFCIHIHCHSCWCTPFDWVRTEWIHIAGIRIGGIRIEWIPIETMSIDRMGVEWISVGWCLLICMVWHTPTIFWRTLRRNVFREKTKGLNFKVHQTCTGTKTWTFKVHQTYTGTNKNQKNKMCTIYLWRGGYPAKVFVFCPCAGLVHFEVQKLCFLSLCRFCALSNLNLLFVLRLWGFGMTHGLLSK